MMFATAFTGAPAAATAAAATAAAVAVCYVFYTYCIKYKHNKVKVKITEYLKVTCMVFARISSEKLLQLQKLRRWNKFVFIS